MENSKGELNKIGENRTEYTKETYIALNNVTSQGAIRIFIISMVVAIMAGVLLLIIGEEDERQFAYVVLGLGLVFFPLMFLFLKRNLNKAVETNLRVNKNAVLTYSFYDDKVEVYAKSDTQEGTSQYQYNSFVKIIESSRYLFLYVHSNVAFCINKNNFEVGVCENVIDVIKKHARKFISKK